MCNMYIILYITAIPMSYFIFFFQAEDGIRDLTVTGVQTCALPIFRALARLLRLLYIARQLARSVQVCRQQVGMVRVRSEERRVGKECRVRGVVERLKKNSICLR